MLGKAGIELHFHSQDEFATPDYLNAVEDNLDSSDSDTDPSADQHVQPNLVPIASEEKSSGVELSHGADDGVGSGAGTLEEAKLRWIFASRT